MENIAIDRIYRGKKYYLLDYGHTLVSATKRCRQARLCNLYAFKVYIPEGYYKGWAVYYRGKYGMY